MNAKDIDALAALYTSNARLMPPNAEMATGTNAVRDTFAGMIDAGIAANLTSVETRVAGDIGYNVGTYVLRAGDEVVDTGKYVETWQRADDGQWRIANDIWNSDVAPAPAPVADIHTHLMILHEVEDADHWLAAWRGENSRHQLFEEHGAPRVHTMRNADDPNLTGLIVGVSDLAALQAMLESAEGQAAATADGVKLDTMVLLSEVE